MPIHYDIHPGLDLLLYIFEGESSAREYFDLYHSIYLNDARRHPGMKILMDLSNSEFYFEAKNLHEAIAIMADNKRKDHPRDHVALLSKSNSSIGLMTKTLKAMGDHLPMDLEIFYNFYEAAQWLELAEQEKEAMSFWQEFTHRKK